MSTDREDIRTEWIRDMRKIVMPVLGRLAEGVLKEELPVSWHPDRAIYAPLEALGRIAEGVAPFLNGKGGDAEERISRSNVAVALLKAVCAATDPASPEYMNFSEGYGQALVDAAFLAHGIVRAPNLFRKRLPEPARRNLIEALRATRTFTPFVSNWILFSAMIEAGLYTLDEKADMTRVDYAVQMMRRWYVGDGTYSDGDSFHWDYYNSFVIQPMLIDILRVFEKKGRDYDRYLEEAVAHGRRFAAVQEQMIGPDGSWAVFGRSSVYRFGCFQLLAQAAQEHFLPKSVTPAQVRCGLSAAIRRSMDAPGTFDEQGFLKPGICGFQPSLAEEYISVGSLYLCTAAFLPLGLGREDEFWKDADADWTGKKIWSGQDVMRDHAED
ncbi:MAG: DUF2264 domain-containing protein [Clostridia bacterium]|nr:DUF2264 domain-containing protein [Clostridia bacterium]